MTTLISFRNWTKHFSASVLIRKSALCLSVCSVGRPGVCLVGVLQDGGVLEILGGWVSKHRPPPVGLGQFWVPGCDDACADRGVQKSKGKGKQVPKDAKGGTGKKRKRSEDSSSEDSDSSDFKLLRFII